MLHSRNGTLLALFLGVTLPSLAAAQQRLTIAIVPTQHFKADAESAENVTRGVAEQFRQQGYTVVPMERSRATFEEMRLDERRDIGDRDLLRLGRRVGADLVAHPELLAAGLSAAGRTDDSTAARPRAVLYLRVLNARTGKPLYSRQIAYQFEGDVSDGGTAYVPPSVARAAASAITRPYFERVAGSRQEIGRPR